MMTSTPKRRWFRFSLRTLFVVVTVLGIWLGWNAEIVRERTAMRNTIRRSGGYIILDHTVLGPLDENGNDVIGNQLFDLVGGDYQIPFVSGTGR